MDKDHKGNVYQFRNNRDKMNNKNMKQTSNKSSSNVRKFLSLNERLGRILIAFLAIFVLLIGRLGWLQLVQGADLKEDMQRQMTASKIISPKRGAVHYY